MNIRKLIESTKGKIFTVTFIKKNGEKRIMKARLDVEKYVTGKGMSFDPKKKGLINVFDMGIEDYRNIKLNSIRKLKCGNIKFTK